MGHTGQKFLSDVIQRLSHIEAAWKNNDLLYPCFIIFPTGKGIQLLTNEDGSAKEMYLFTHYRQLTCDQVAASCRYYTLNVRYPITTIVNGTIATTSKRTFHIELEWTYNYFRNNIEPQLYEKVQSKFATF